MGKKSPLHTWQEKNGAAFVDDGGWDVVLNYGRWESEYGSIRNGCALVDRCHESRFRINGDARSAFLNNLVTIDLDQLAPHQLGFGFFCNDNGSIIDGVRVVKDEQYLLVCGHPSARNRLGDWLRAKASELEGSLVEVVDVGTAQGMIELYGPASKNVLESALVAPMRLESNSSMLGTIANARCLILKSEVASVVSFSIIAGSVYIQAIWESLVAAGKPMGLRTVGSQAFEVFRIESGFPRLGRDVEADVNPVEIGAAGSVNFKKARFTGRRALLHATASEFSRRMVQIKSLTDQVPPEKAEIGFDGMPIGVVTSSTLSPANRAGIAFGFVDAIKSGTGTKLTVAGPNGAQFGVEVVRSAFPAVV